MTTGIFAELPAPLRGVYKALLLVRFEDDGEPSFHLRSGKEVNDHFTIEDVRTAIFCGAVHTFDSDRVTILKDVEGVGNVVSFDEAIKRAQTTIAEWRGGPPSMALNDSIYWHRPSGIGVEFIRKSNSQASHNYFSKSSTFKSEFNVAFPFLLFEGGEQEVLIHEIQETKRLLDWPRHTRVIGPMVSFGFNPSGNVAIDLSKMIVWHGFEIGELKLWMSSHNIPENLLGTPGFTNNALAAGG
jgi:hypothetical protein